MVKIWIDHVFTELDSELWISTIIHYVRPDTHESDPLTELGLRPRSERESPIYNIDWVGI